MTASPAAGTYADADHAPVESIHLWGGAQPRAPYGAAILFIGWRGSGKGLAMASLAAAVTNGTALPGETEGRDPGDVILVTAEDDATEDVAWRLRAAGANLARCHDLTRLPDGNRFKLSATPLWPGHIADLRAKIGQLVDAGRNPQLVILDPLNALIGRGTIKTDQGARHVMEQLQDVAKDTGVVIAIIHHFVKSGSIGGSQGLVDAARIVYTIKPDPDSTELKVLHLEKANVLGRTGDLRYRIIEDGHATRIEWQDDAVIEQQRANWRDRLARRQASQRPAPVTPQQAKAAGCDHSRTRYGTPRQCPDCPAAALCAPQRPAAAAPAVTWNAFTARAGQQPERLVGAAAEDMARMVCEARAGHPLQWQADGRGGWQAVSGMTAYAIAPIRTAGRATA